MEVLSRPAAIEGCTLHPSQSGAMDRTCFRLLMPVGWHQVEHSFTTNQPHIGYLLVCVIELKEKRGCIVLSTHDYDSLTFELNRRCFVKQQWVPNHLDFWLHDMPCQCVLTSCIPRCDLLSVIKPKGWWCGKLYKRWGLNMQQVTWMSLKVFNICWVILEMMGNKTWWMPCIKRNYLWIKILYNARNIGHSSTGATGLFNSGCITLKLGCRSSSWNASTANTPCTECNPHKLKRFVRCAHSWCYSLHPPHKMRKKTPTCKGQHHHCSQSAEGESAIHLNHTLATDVVPHFNFKLAFSQLLSIPCIAAFKQGVC